MVFPECDDGSLGCYSNERLEFREGFLDGIESRRVRWKKTHRCADRLDRLAKIAGHCHIVEAVSA